MRTAKESREARRKRILERGSDRLAYITGDTSKHQYIKTSSISPPQETLSVSDTAHTADGGYGSSIESQDAEQEGFGLSDPVTESAGDFQKPLSCSKPSYSTLISAEPLDTTPVLESSSRSFAEPPTNMVPVASTSSEPSKTKPAGFKARKKSSTTYMKNIVDSIEASEGLRVLAAAFVAVFVVSQTILSCCGHTWGGALSVLLPRWPIGLVLLTDLSLVAGAYITHSHSKSLQKGQGSAEDEGLDDSLEKISQALDVVGRFEDLLNVGLLCKKAAGAISLDCSIYIVTLVCGFSLSQYAFSCCKGF